MPFTSIAQGACSLSEPQPKFSLVIITFFPATSAFGLKPSSFKLAKGLAQFGQALYLGKKIPSEPGGRRVLRN